MDMAAELTPDMLQKLFALRDRIDAAAHGQKGAIVGEFCALHGTHIGTVHRWLKDHAGRKTNRKRRADAGTTRIDDTTLTFIAGAKREAFRANGKDTMPLGVAMNVAAANGLEVPVSKSRVATLLRQRRMDAATVMAARNHIELRSLYPNHVHEIDPSLCLIYYIGGRQMCMRAEEFYKNKLDKIAKVKLKVWRYTRYEHASGVFDVRYFESAGESQHCLFEFLLYTWSKQPNRLSYGVPKILLWDKGSANTSHAIKHLLDALGVDHRTHAAGHAWVKGGVEQANNLVETQFESRLRFEPVESVEELNAAAERWARDYNANAIEHVDCRLRRASGEPMVRDDLWQTILRHPGALVEMPERKVCQWFLRGQEATRQVRDLQITFVHPEIGKTATYKLAAWAELLGRNVTVRVAPVLLRNGLLRVEIDRMGDEPLIVEVEPERDFDAYGRCESSPVIGEEYSRAKQTADEAIARKLEQAAYGEGVTADDADALRAKQVTPFAHMNGGRGVVAHSHLGQCDLPERILPPPQTLETPQIAAARKARVEVQPLSVEELARQLKKLVEADGGEWSVDRYRWLSQRYPDGAQPDQVKDIAAELAAPRAGHPLQIVRAN
ncbi:DDE-type integrase/transposase/recombinase [Rhodocyclus tenuis]|uniref:Integrase catalytic domain-containing protein n=1 Tax=Rhodocyclus tenuis TaxID=1066 RepID=A0A840G908_RHOTE|nr:DDE-type integrase/transposase/recombinase [Rhodocyclus tenuis]MBB4248355.1 hypothetical protein [Rhodocyclus tenuis]